MKKKVIKALGILSGGELEICTCCKFEKPLFMIYPATEKKFVKSIANYTSTIARVEIKILPSKKKTEKGKETPLN